MDVEVCVRLAERNGSHPRAGEPTRRARTRVPRRARHPRRAPHPAPPKRSAMWERGATIRRARAALPRSTFARLYLEEYRSLKWIAKHADVNEEAIKVLVREYGMTRAGKATRWRQIDLDSLREQRAAGRTCRELAEETGFSLGMISYLGRRHDLPGRRPARQG
ncbi:hypothetical protein SLNWT_7103 [Streptomyces albus]|uniref:Uncharacterized protein n=2 Tax=Streptomyces TaxID=1883 RepID=A0A0B5F074_STRA4|nr:hypothetical protein SLNWT_7103 [Streptomyces albus]